MKKYFVVCVLMLHISLTAKNIGSIISQLPNSLQDDMHVQAHRAYRQLVAYAKGIKPHKKTTSSIVDTVKSWFKHMHATQVFIWYIELRKHSKYASPKLTQRMRSILRSMGVYNTSHYYLKIYDDVDRNGVVFPFEPTTIYLSQGTLDSGSQDIIDFTIAHECSHVLYENPFKIAPGIAAVYVMLTYAWRKTKQLCFSSSVSSMPQTIIEESLKSAILYLGFRKYICYREKRADLNAAQALGTAYGGIIDLGAAYLLYGDDGNDPWHPSLQERISYLYEWECKNCKVHGHK